MKYTDVQHIPYIEFNSNMRVEVFQSTDWLQDKKSRDLIDDFIKSSGYPIDSWDNYLATSFAFVRTDRAPSEPDPLFLCVVPHRLIEYNLIDDERSIIVLYVEYNRVYNIRKPPFIRIYLMGCVSSRSERFHLDKYKNGFNLFGNQITEKIYLIPRNKLTFTPISNDQILDDLEGLGGIEPEDNQSDFGLLTKEVFPYFYNFEVLGMEEEKVLYSKGLDIVMKEYFQGNSLDKPEKVIAITFMLLIIHYKPQHYDEFVSHEQSFIKEHFKIQDKGKFLESQHLGHVRSKIVDRLSEYYLFNDYLCELLHKRYTISLKTINHTFLNYIEKNKTMSMLIQYYVNKNQLFE